MKKIITTVALAISSSFAFSQIGAVAPNFTVTDINGGSHTLYSYLNAGKVVVLDVSATWCGPCWSFHGEHFLNEINAEYGANGTNEVVVLFYEGDAATLSNALNGTGGSTQGDWVTGTTYPIVNESPLQLDLNIYAPLGFPTINVICPSDKKIKADLWDNFGSDHTTSYNAMKGVIDNTITNCVAASAGLNELVKIDFKAFPNPTNGKTTITLNDAEINKADLLVYSVTGILISSNEVDFQEGSHIVDLGKFERGTYFIQVKTDSNSSKMVSVIKQ